MGCNHCRPHIFITIIDHCCELWRTTWLQKYTLSLILLPFHNQCNWATKLTLQFSIVANMNKLSVRSKEKKKALFLLQKHYHHMHHIMNITLFDHEHFIAKFKKQITFLINKVMSPCEYNKRWSLRIHLCLYMYSKRKYAVKILLQPIINIIIQTIIEEAISKAK